MKTIRGKIIFFFLICLAFISLLTALYYENTFSLRKELYMIERFDDLLNDVLELRRYEKNFVYYRDLSSLREGTFYLAKIDRDFKILHDDIQDIVGSDESGRFLENLAEYRRVLEAIMDIRKPEIARRQVDMVRTRGKSLIDFTQKLIQAKRQRIEGTLKRALTIPLAVMGIFIVLILVIFRIVNRDILGPLKLVKIAIEEVAKETFTPIHYDTEKQDEITRLIASFNKMVDELESRQEQLLQSRKLASIGTFTSGIAHELNNPLNNIAITAESLLSDYRDMPEEEMDEMISEILGQADRASQVVKNLLEFSRTEQPYLRNLDIGEVLEHTIRLIKNQLMVTHIRTEKEIAEGLPPVRGKRQDLQQAFINILLNAVQAMPEGGVIGIRAGLDPGGYIRIDLSDTGTGIKPEALAHIFDPFFTTKQVGQGTGLGLSLVYGIIRTHGGYIEVKSEEGRGTTFSIYLPTSKGEDTGDEIQDSSD